MFKCLLLFLCACFLVFVSTLVHAELSVCVYSCLRQNLVFVSTLGHAGLSVCVCSCLSLNLVFVSTLGHAGLTLT